MTSPMSEPQHEPISAAARPLAVRLADVIAGYDHRAALEGVSPVSGVDIADAAIAIA